MLLGMSQTNGVVVPRSHMIQKNIEIQGRRRLGRTFLSRQGESEIQGNADYCWGKHLSGRRMSVFPKEHCKEIFMSVARSVEIE